MYESEVEYVAQSRQLRSEKNFAYASSTLDAGLAKYPDSLKLAIESASLAMDQKDFQRATGLWAKLISKFGNKAPLGAHVRLSVAHRKLGNLDQSRLLIENIIENGRANAAILFERGMISFCEKSWLEAIKYFARAKSIAGTQEEEFAAEIQLALSHIKAENFDDARSLLVDLLKSDKSGPYGNRIKATLAILCYQESKKDYADAWLQYWDSRSDYVYVHVCKQIMKIIGASASVVVDVGSNRTPTLEFLPHSSIRFSVDPINPYEGEGIRAVREDFLKWEPDREIHFGTCLQVMEHMANPNAFAKRLLQLCEVVLVSVPYMEPPGLNPEHIHNNIDLNTMANWFGKTPNYHYIAEELSGGKRIICVFDTRSSEIFDSFNKESMTAMRFRFRWSLDGSGISFNEEDKKLSLVRAPERPRK